MTGFHDSHRPLVWLLLAGLLLPTLVACGGGDDEPTPSESSIQWVEGTIPPSVTAEPTASSTTSGPPAASVAPANEPAPTHAARVAGTPLSDDQLAKHAPNELGSIPILEYHAFTEVAAEDTNFIRYIGNFQRDLEWLYEHQFYVISLRSVILGEIDVPLGKHPVVLTFDDSTAGQFRFLKKSDGRLAIDPKSAIAILESFFRKHPDFGRGGFFSALPSPNVCFSWDEEDQEPYCQQKVRWLLDHGYEIGNHTLNHLRIDTLNPKELAAEIGEPFLWFARHDPRAVPDILAVPFGEYPEGNQQLEMLREGFRHEGQSYTLIGCLMVGSQPAPSPASTDWDTLYIPRVQVADTEDWGNSRWWFAQMVEYPDQLFTSDGDSNVFSIPIEAKLPENFRGTLNEQALRDAGFHIVRY